MDNDESKTTIEDVYGNIKTKSISGTLTREALLNDIAMAAKKEYAKLSFTVRGRIPNGSR